jgi:hypothetical protein
MSWTPSLVREATGGWRVPPGLRRAVGDRSGRPMASDPTLAASGRGVERPSVVKGRDDAPSLVCEAREDGELPRG